MVALSAITDYSPEEKTIEKLGGTIGVISALGKGSTFTVILPIH